MKAHPICRLLFVASAAFATVASAAEPMKVDVLGCELAIDSAMRGAISFHDSNAYMSFTADDGSSIAIVEEDEIPHATSTALSETSVTKERANGFDVYDIVSTTKTGKTFREMQLLDGKGHKIVFSGPIAGDWKKALGNCGE